MINTIQKGMNATIGFFDHQCDKVGEFLDHHPVLYKVVLVASHIFRAASMYALMMIIPGSPYATFAGLLAASLIYRAAVERFCAFRFALPSMAGGIAFWAGHASCIAMAAGTAFASLSESFLTCLGLLSVGAYLVYISYRSYQDIENRMATLSLTGKSCCK